MAARDAAGKHEVLADRSLPRCVPFGGSDYHRFSAEGKKKSTKLNGIELSSLRKARRRKGGAALPRRFYRTEEDWLAKVCDQSTTAFGGGEPQSTPPLRFAITQASYRSYGAL